MEITEGFLGNVIPYEMAPTIALQTYTILSGVAGGLAGLALARMLAKKDSVPTGAVLWATLLSFGFTLLPAIWLGNKAQ